MEDKVSWLQNQCDKYLAALTRSNFDKATSGRSSSEIYIGLSIKQEEDDPNKVQLPEEVSSPGPPTSILKYFIHLTKNVDEQIDLRLIDQMISKGADINETDRYGQIVLHQVAKSWQIDVAQFLIERKADVNKADDFGKTPLHVAAAVDYAEMVTFLIKEGGANINAVTKGKQTPLHYAAKHDAVNSVKVLIAHNAEANSRDHKQRTPLQLAAELDRSEAARLLINLKSDAGVQDNTGQSCMTLLVMNMPPVALLALDQFFIKDRANRRQHFYLNLVQPRTTDFSGSQAKSPLEMIVQNRQLDIIMHPVIQKLIEVKWKLFGRTSVAFMLTLNLVLILSWTALGIASSLPRTEEAPYKFPEDCWRIILIVIALGLTLYQILEEFKEIYQAKKRMKRWKEWRKKELEKDLKYCHPMWPEEKEYLQKGIEDLNKVHSGYFRDFWNIFDWIVYFLLLAVIVTHIADITVQSNTDMHTHHVRIFSVTIIFLWLRLMKHARAIRLLGPFIVMLEKIMVDVVKFLFLYGEFYIPYACAFWIIFGGKVPNMASVDQMLFAIFRITLVDDYGFSDMYNTDAVMAYILCGTFLGISSILCINLLIALLADTFQRVYDNATANAAMQQASTLLQIEEGLSKKRRSKYDKYFQDDCSPLTLFYDDDLTVNQEDDLKKVTIQIKDELDKLMEMLKKNNVQQLLNDMPSKIPKTETPKPSPKKTNRNAVARTEAQQQEILKMLPQLFASQQEQRETLLQMNQKLLTLETLISEFERSPVSVPEVDLEKISVQSIEQVQEMDQSAVSAHGHLSADFQSHVTVDIIGRTRHLNF
uniref:XCAT2 protein n=1 Tax=Xenopus laevis TaxID=8355 RepID=B7ZR85_XENLA|nr:XCAT2 protein [Xenopus laevis]